MKTYIIFILAFLASNCAPALSQPKTKPANGFDHFVGEAFGGGVVFEVWKDAKGIEHGRVVSPVTQSEGMGWSKAMTLCRELKTGGFSDWRLPTTDELWTLRKNRKKVNKGLNAMKDAQALLEWPDYWSRDDVDEFIAGSFDLEVGKQFENEKSATLMVRAVREY